jgi:hypothetical protein
MFRVRKGFGVFFWMIVMLIFWLLVVGIYFVQADDTKQDKTSYYQFTPNPNSVVQPGTIWNPIITEHKNGKVSRSYFQHKPGVFRVEYSDTYDVFKSGGVVNVYKRVVRRRKVHWDLVLLDMAPLVLKGWKFPKKLVRMAELTAKDKKTRTFKGR